MNSKDLASPTLLITKIWDSVGVMERNLNITGYHIPKCELYI